MYCDLPALMCIERYFLMYFSITALFHALPFFIAISSLFTLSQLSFLFCLSNGY